MFLKKKSKKVLICLSGGVDSSVAALLLKKQGYDVTAAYMKQWSDTKELTGVCTWKEERRDAMRVAAHLDLPFLTLDFEKEYKDWVIEYMFEEYKKGRTPNPDVMCNKFIKFDAWLKKAREMGFDYMATGHYAFLQETRYKIQDTNNKKIQYKLVCAKDENKDQTYFLHQLGQEQLAHTLFPLGKYTKDEVRALAKKHNLPTATKAESMGICFVGEVPIKEFLEQKIKHTPGDILLSSGEKIGEHDGLSFYTIGQRHLKAHNLNSEIISKKSNSKNATEPLFVLDKNFEKNQLIVGFENDPLLYKKKIQIRDMHFIGQEPLYPLQCKVRMRHRQSLQECIVTKENNNIFITFKQEQKAITPGQFAVLYEVQKGLRNHVECLGGGIIA